MLYYNFIINIIIIINFIINIIILFNINNIIKYNVVT